MATANGSASAWPRTPGFGISCFTLPGFDAPSYAFPHISWLGQIELRIVPLPNLPGKHSIFQIQFNAGIHGLPPNGSVLLRDVRPGFRIGCVGLSRFDFWHPLATANGSALL